jgi:hypothetical protein
MASTGPAPHEMPLDGGQLTVAQADFVLRLVRGFRAYTDEDYADAEALKAQLGQALKTWDAAQPDN